MNLRLSSTIQELAQEKLRHNDSKTVLKRLTDEVYKCAGQIQDPKLLKKSVEKMCAQYCSKPEIKNNSSRVQLFSW